MQSSSSKTKLIWTLSQASFERNSPQDIARLLAEHRLDAVRATFTESLKPHLIALRQALADELSKDRRVATPQGWFPFVLNFAGREAGLLVPKGTSEVTEGQSVEMTLRVDFDTTIRSSRFLDTNAYEIVVTAPDMLASLKVGSVFSISYGLVEARIVEIGATQGGPMRVQVRFSRGATLISGMDVASTDMSRDLFPLVPQDAHALETRFGGLADYVVVQGLKSVDELLSLKRTLVPGSDRGSKRHPSTPIGPSMQDATATLPPRLLWKVESKRALELVPDVMPLVDGVFLSRSELGLTVEPNSLPIVQKELLAQCNQQAKVVIVASELMFSMRTNPNPTRAEVSDMANAVADGADALVLSEEVTEGPYSELVAAVSKETLVNSEPTLENNWHRVPFSINNDDDAIAYGALQVAEQSGARAIVCLTEGGYTAFRLSTLRTPADIIAVSYNSSIMRQLNLLRSVSGLVLENVPKFDQLLAETKALLCRHYGFVRGDKIVFVSLTASSVAARNSNLFTVQDID